ncbi:alcohol dehydrogenase [Pantoea sp. B65]|uniref:alcohol dehydrogenase n=1 Tax=Pantoea sp. B65 TaxID=2813359 RepID=UPI0039B54637
MAQVKSYILPQYGAQVEKVEHPLPELGPQDVLLRVTHAGVCHSDIYIQDGYQDLGNGQRINFADSSMPIPLVMGHEIVGDVVAVGDNASAALIGQRRLVYPWLGCGSCIACDAGTENHCENGRSLGIFRHGGYADYVVVPAAKYLVDIGDLDPAWSSTLACSGLTVFSALKQLQPLKAGGAVAIIGAGGLGLNAVGIAKELGFANIIVCDISDDRLEAAKDLGATQILNTRHAGSSSLQALADNKLLGVVDTVGLPQTLQLAIDSCAKGARIVLVGLQGGSINVGLPVLPFKALSIIGTYTGSLAELQDLITLARKGNLKSLPITEKPLSCLCETLNDLRKGNVVGRVVLNP